MSITTERIQIGPRLAKLQEIIGRRKLSGVVVCSYQNVTYFAGTHILTQVIVPDRLAFLVVPRDEEPTLIVCSVETRQVRSQTTVRDLREYTEFVDDPTAMLADVLKQRKMNRGSIGVDGRRLPMASAAALESKFSDLKLTGIDDDLELVQAIKDPGQIAILEMATKATVAAAEETAAELPAGASERDFTTTAFAKLMRRGGVPTFCIFASGTRMVQAHPESSDEPMQPGELWRIDFGGRFQEVIQSCVSRTGVVGEPTPEQEGTLKALLGAIDIGVSMLQPGRRAKEVFNAVKAEFARQGLPFTLPHTGHSISTGLHEYPMLEPTNETVLQPGMVLNIEPLVAIESRREAYMTCTLVEVTSHQPRVITPPQRQLLRLKV
jgi:Xaa-Pro aminopeptidase